MPRLPRPVPEEVGTGMLAENMGAEEGRVWEDLSEDLSKGPSQLYAEKLCLGQPGSGKGTQLFISGKVGTS